LEHVHDVPASVARARGVHDDGALRRAASAAVSAEEGLFARGISDAIAGALLGALIGDALAAPLHWVYNHDALNFLRGEHFDGGLTGYAAAPPSMVHPDSHKYFSRCDPSAEPVPGIFGGRAAMWTTPGTPYHRGLAAGDNTLTGRLLAGLIEIFAADAQADAAAFLKMYVSALVAREGPAAHADAWVDETHRVFLRNLAAGADPAESGMEDSCLSSLVLALPALLLYAFNRDAAALGVRVTSQFTHKSESAARDALWLGDVFAVLLAPYALATRPRAGAEEGAEAAPAFSASAASTTAQLRGSLVYEAFKRASASFSEGRTDLDRVLAAFPPSRLAEEAFFGPAVIFSSR
jgi:ADP-ribosylglycohydrolase